jgi:hypothetical protein
VPSNGAGSIALHATDALRFGYCLLRGGAWAGEQLVPADFVRRCGGWSTVRAHRGRLSGLSASHGASLFVMHIAGRVRVKYGGFWPGRAGVQSARALLLSVRAQRRRCEALGVLDTLHVGRRGLFVERGTAPKPSGRAAAGHVLGAPRDAFWKSGAGGFSLYVAPSRGTRDPGSNCAQGR